MTKERKCFVYLMLAGILWGHLVCLVLGVEAWPFSRYPMYAKASDTAEGFKKWQIVGIPLDSRIEPFDLPTESLPQIASLNSGINRLMRDRTEGEPVADDRLEAGLRGLAAMYYHHQRKEGLEEIPLREVRLYRRTWLPEREAGERKWVEQEWKLEARAILDGTESRKFPDPRGKKKPEV